MMIKKSKELLNHFETKDFLGLKRRKPTDEEIEAVINIVAHENVFKSFVTKNRKKFNLESDMDLLQFFNHIDTEIRVDYESELKRCMSYEEVTSKVEKRKSEIRDSYRDMCMVIDMEHINTRIVFVLILSLPESESVIGVKGFTAEVKRFYFCNKCSHLHTLQDNEFIRYK